VVFEFRMMVPKIEKFIYFQTKKSGSQRHSTFHDSVWHVTVPNSITVNENTQLPNNNHNKDARSNLRFLIGIGFEWN